MKKVIYVQYTATYENLFLMQGDTDFTVDEWNLEAVMKIKSILKDQIVSKISDTPAIGIPEQKRLTLTKAIDYLNIGHIQCIFTVLDS